MFDIWVPKKEIIHRAMANTEIRVEGLWRAVLLDELDNIKLDTGWHKNQITDIGLVQMGATSTDNWRNYCHVGSGTSTPDPTDTALDTFMGSSNSRSGGAFTRQTADPWGIFEQQVYRFNAGNATGTIREAGISWNTVTGSLFSRFLVTPAIVKNADQVLDIYWEFRMYRQGSDIINTNVDIPEDGISVLYNTITRGSNYNSINPGTAFRQFGAYQGSWNFAFSGPIGSITGSPSGTSDSSYGLSYPGSVVPITDGAYRDVTWSAPLTEANVGGIRCTRHRHDHNYDVQIQYTDVATGTRLIPKDNTNILDLSLRTTWKRA